MGDRIGMSIPAKPEHLLAVRLAASGVCSRLGMGIDSIEDVKAAVAEACLMVIHDAAGFQRLDVSFLLDGGIEVEVRGSEPGAAPREGDFDADLSSALLEALTENTRTGSGFVKFTVPGGPKP